jgi:hypothetical protein
VGDDVFTVGLDYIFTIKFKATIYLHVLTGKESIFFSVSNFGAGVIHDSPAVSE